MRYTVVWTDAALNELARVWMQAADPVAVRAASNEIDRELARDPETKGVEYYGDRLLVIPPLQATFAVHPDDREVVVLNVW
jgi:hypothetical protein